MAAAAGLIADSVVRDFLGMKLGHPGYFSGPDLLAVALAWGVAVPGLVIWHRMLRNPKDGASDCPTRPSELSGSRRFRLEASLLLVWLGSAHAVFLLLYAGISSILADQEAGRLNFIILLALLAVNFRSLGPVFGRFGAKPLPADPIG